MLLQSRLVQAYIPWYEIQEIPKAWTESCAAVLRKTGWDRPGNHARVSNLMTDPAASTTAQASGQQTSMRLLKNLHPSHAILKGNQWPQRWRSDTLSACTGLQNCLLTWAQSCWGDAVSATHSSRAFRACVFVLHAHPVAACLWIPAVF